MSGGDVTISYLKRLTELLAGQDKFNVDITGGTISNVDLLNIDSLTLDSPLPIASGGTGAATASAARDALGLEIGVDVQAYDAGLASIAGLTTAADKGIYTTASDTYATFDLTSAGRALLDDANASAQRTTLGLGTIATQNSDSISVTGGSMSGVAVTTGSINNTPIGASTANTGAFTTVTASTSVTSSLMATTNINAEGSGGGALRTASGANCFAWGGGNAVNNTAYENLLITGSSSAAGHLMLREDSDNGTNSVALYAPASVTADRTITLPDASGTVALTSNISQGGLVLLGSYTASNATSVDIGSGLDLDAAIDGTYDEYELHIISLVPASISALFMRTSTDGGVSFDAAAGDYHYRRTNELSSSSYSADQTGSDTEIELSTATIRSDGVCHGVIRLFSPASSQRFVIDANIAAQQEPAATSCIGFLTKGARDAAADVNALRIFMSSGNITSGTFYLYGIRKS